jgi:hypothetical protein
MSISSREDANKYYQTINSLVDDYIDKWKVRPSNLKRYLQPGGERFNKFLERNGLKDIKGADRVLRDIIEDRESMESDGVITFESFKLFESDDYKLSSLKQCLYKGIEKSSNIHEKILADHFDTSLGHIDVVDSDKHIFKVDVWGKSSDVIVYSKEEIGLITENMMEYLFNDLKSKKVELSGNIMVSLSNLITEESFKREMEENVFSTNKPTSIVTQCLGYEFKAEFENYFIWVKND